jgi:hypothetical protein
MVTWSKCLIMVSSRHWFVEAHRTIPASVGFVRLDASADERQVGTPAGPIAWAVDCRRRGQRSGARAHSQGDGGQPPR